MAKVGPAPAKVDLHALAAELLEAAGDFSSPSHVHRVMAIIFHAMVQRRLSAREAGVLCFIAQTILHSHRAIAYHEKLQAEAAVAEKRRNEPDKLTWNLPPR